MRCVSTWLVFLSVGLLALAPRDAAAQSEGQFAVGLGVSAKGAPDEGVDAHIGPALIWRFGHGHDGWGWQYGLGWYSVDLAQPLGPSLADFGELHVKPVLGGYGYSRRIGRSITTAKLVGGYAFTSFKLLPAYDDRYRALLGASTVTTDVSNAFVVKPELSTWIDLSRKIGVNIGISYTVARPEVTIASSLGRDTRAIRADVLTFRIGAVYSVF